MTHNSHWTESQLEELFDRQMQLLEKRGCSERALHLFLDQRPRVIEYAQSLTIANNDATIPFVPVIPPTYRTLLDQMHMIEKDGVGGFSFIDPLETQDEVETPDKPYFVFDVDTGEDLREMRVRDALKKLSDKGRTALTAAEAIALGLHSNVLNEHEIYAANTRYKEKGRVLHIALDSHRFALGYYYELHSAHPEWSTPSCRERHAV